MIYISLIVLIAILVSVNLLIHLNRYRAAVAIWVFLIGLTTCPVIYFIFPPPATWQVLAMCVLLFVLLVSRWGRRLYLTISVVASLIAYGSFFQSVHKKEEEWATLKQEFAYESLAERLPYRVAGNSSAGVGVRRLNELEKQLSDREYHVTGARWSPALRHLHENSVDEFVNSPGFGVGRWSNTTVVSELDDYHRQFVQHRPPVRQPDYFNPFITTSGNLKSTLQDKEAGKMLHLHDDLVVDFVNVDGFGFAWDRLHVAGFQKHGISKAPEGNTVWSVAHVELVGLVVHENPVVYLTANLPQMEEVLKAPMRALDPFEMEALDRLRDGEELYFRGSADKGRMMGAIRAVRQCLVCHGGSRGDLLGAFSYGLIREKTQP